MLYIEPLRVLRPTHRRPIPQGDFKHGQHRAREPRHISAFRSTMPLRKMMIHDDDDDDDDDAAAADDDDDDDDDLQDRMLDHNTPRSVKQQGVVATAWNLDGPGQPTVAGSVWETIT